MLTLLLRALIVVGMAAAFLPVLGSTRASAHTGLETSLPADGEVLTDVPAAFAVELTFTEALRADFAQLAVTGPDGQTVNTGALTVDGPTLRQPADVAANGAYVVAYRVVGSDGHPISGQLAFTVNAVAASPLPSASPAPSTAEVAESTPSPTSSASAAAVSPAAEDTDASSSWWPVLAVGAVLAAALLAGLAHLRRRRTHG